MAADPRKNWRSNRFFGGYSDDEFIGIDGSVWRASGLELRRFPRRIQLQKRTPDQSAGAIEGQVLCATVTSYGDAICAGQDGKVYRRAQNATTWTKVYTFASAQRVLDVKEYNGYLYFSTQDKLNRIIITDTNTSVAWTTMTAGYQTFAYSTTEAHPLFEAFNQLFCGDGAVLAKLDSFATWTASALQLSNDDLITRITFSGTLIKVWTRKQATYIDVGHVTFWNGASDAYQERTQLDGYFQTCCTSDGGYDFFIAGHQPKLYRLDGLVGTPIKKLPMLTNPVADDVTTVGCKFFPNAMASRGGIVYFGSPTGMSGIGVSWLEGGVWSWGRKDEKYPPSLNLDFPASVDVVTCVFVGDALVSFAAVNGSSKYLYGEVSNAYQATGLVETRVFDGADAEQIKDAKRLSIAFWPLAVGEKIEVFAKTNLGASYGSAILTAQYSDAADVGVTYKDLLTPFVGKEFNTVQLEVVLTAGNGQSTTPKLFDLLLGYEDVRPN